MYYIPSTSTLKPLRAPSDLYAFGPFLSYRLITPLQHQVLPGCLFPLQVPARPVVTVLSHPHASTPPLVVEVEGHESTSIRDGSLRPSMARGCRGTKPSMLSPTGLLPITSQDSLLDASSWMASENELELELCRNNSDAVSLWAEPSMYITEECTSEDVNERFLHEPAIGGWPARTSSDTRFPHANIFSPKEGLFASTSFFGDMLASSSSPNMRSADAHGPLEASPASVAFSIQSESRVDADKSGDVADTQEYQSLELLVEDDDLNPEAAFNCYFPAMEPNGSFSFEADFPLLPSESEVAEFLASGAAPDEAASNTSFSLDLEHLMQTSPLITSDISLAPLSSAPSLVMSAFSSIESLLRVSLDIPADLSFGSRLSSLSSFSSCISLCEVPTYPSSDDLARVEPPPSLDLDTHEDEDEDDFRPLPPDTKSPFEFRDGNTPDLSKDSEQPSHTSRKSRPSLPTLYENFEVV